MPSARQHGGGARAAACCNIQGYSKNDTEKLLTRLYQVRSEFTHAAPVEVVFNGATLHDARLEARQLQSFVYLYAAQAYCEVLADPALVAQFNTEGIGPYWGQVVQGAKAPPFTVALNPQDWSYDKDAWLGQPQVNGGRLG